MDALKGITWQAVVALAIVAGTVLGLVALGQPLAAIGSAFGAAIWYVTSRQESRATATEQQLGKIEKQVNGTNEALRTENAQLHKVIAVLAAQLPPGTPLPPALTKPTDQVNGS